MYEQRFVDTRSNDLATSRASGGTEAGDETTESGGVKDSSAGSAYHETEQRVSMETSAKLEVPKPLVAPRLEPGKITTKPRDAIAVFVSLYPQGLLNLNDKLTLSKLPILAYETSKSRKQMTKVIQNPSQEIRHEDKRIESLLLQGYLSEETQSPFHCRRTLDQYFYYMLDTTESRDRDQVIYRWGRKDLKKKGKTGDAPILMVDQLWLWVLHDGINSRIRKC